MKLFPFKKKSFRFSELLPNWKSNQSAKFNDWNTERAIKHGYKASSYVYICVNAISKAVCSVPWHVERQDRNGDWQKVKNHPLEALIDKPTPFHNRKDFMQGMVQHLFLGGNAIFTKVRAGKIVTELWQMPTDAIKVIPSKKDFIDHYFYEKDGIKQRLEQKDIIHNKFNDPNNPYWGISPLMAGAKLVDTDIEAVKFQKISLQNRAITDGVFTFDHPLTKDQWNEAREMVREQHQGKDNARTPWILGAGATYQQMSLSPVEMDFLNSRKFNREEICSLFQVPPPIVGIMDTSTYNNIETARKIFWQDTIIPLLEDIKDCLNLALTPEFGQGIELCYDLSNITALQESEQEKINNAKALFSMGVPFNTISQKLELGIEEIEGGDIGYLPSGLIPSNLLELMEEEETQTDATNEPSNDEEDTPKGKRTIKTKNKKTNAYKRISTRTDAQKNYYFQIVDRKRNQWVLNLTRKSARLFKQEGNLLAESIKNGGNWEKALRQHEQKWISFLSASYQSIVEELGKDHFYNLMKGYSPTEYKDDEEIEDAFNPHDEDITKYIIELAGTKVTQVSDWTRQVIGAIVLEAKENNWTMDKLAKAINDEFTEFARYRAYRIARTETQNALGFAHFKAGERAQEILGQELIGEWVTSGDDRVRDSHEQLHGEKVKLGEAFSNGLKYAGEYTNTGEARDNINCRCVIVHHFD